MGQSGSVMAHFGAELRRYRSKAGLTQEQLGEKVGYTNGLISAVERATRMPSMQLAETLDEVLDTDGVLGRLWPLVDRLGSVTSGFRPYLDKEPQARAIHTHEPVIVPGLLQTEAYARCVIEAERPSLSADVIEARLAVRLTRQDVLARDDPPRLWAIIGEPALHLHVGSKRVMADQLEHLVEQARLPHIIVQVLPYAAGITPAMGMPFLVAEFPSGPDMFHVDAPPGVTPDTDGETASRYRLVFDYLRAAALREDQSAAMVARRVEELRDT